MLVPETKVDCLFAKSVVKLVTADCGIPVKLASTTFTSTSLLTTSSVIVILLDPAFIFLNSRFVPVFCLKTPTPEVPILEFANLASFPVTGETGKIYLALDTNKTYRWSGSAYVQIGGGGGSDLAYDEVMRMKVILNNI